MKTFRKALSLLLVLIMCIGTVPFSVSASDDFLIDGAWWYTVEGGNATIVFCDSTVSGDITIPSKLGGYKVTTIGAGTFNDRKTINSVTLPDTVTTIEANAFKSTSITAINFGKGVKTIGASAFAYCNNLTEVNIPASVTTIEQYAFSTCIGLSKVTIGKGVRTLGMNAFRGCINLKELNINNGIETIGSGAFYDCDKLTSVTLPDSVTTLENYAFQACNELVAVTFGENIKNIGFAAFANCYKLTDVYFKGTTKQWNAVSIDRGNDYMTNANTHILGDPIIPVIPSDPDTPSNPDNPSDPSNPGTSDGGNQTVCSCNCHAKGFKKFIFKFVLFFQKLFRKNQSCECGALHYVIL